MLFAVTGERICLVAVSVALSCSIISSIRYAMATCRLYDGHICAGAIDIQLYEYTSSCRTAILFDKLPFTPEHQPYLLSSMLRSAPYQLGPMMVGSALNPRSIHHEAVERMSSVWAPRFTQILGACVSERGLTARLTQHMRAMSVLV